MVRLIVWLLCALLMTVASPALAIIGKPVGVMSYDMGFRPVSPGFNQVDEVRWQGLADTADVDLSLVGEDGFGAKRHALFEALSAKAETLAKGGDAAAAAAMLRRAIALRRRYLGQVDFRQADGVLSAAYLRLAQLADRAGDPAAALEAHRLLSNHLFQRPKDGGTDCRIACAAGSWQDTHKPKRPYYMAHLLTLVGAVAGSDPTDAVIGEAFDLIQLIENTEVSAAIGRMVADRDATDAGHGELVRERRRLERRIDMVERELAVAERASLGAGDLTVEVLRSQLSSLQFRAAQALQALEQTDPAYRLISSSALMSIAGAREVLRPGEAYVMSVSGQNGSAVLVLRADRAMLYGAPLTDADLADAVDRLRSGLDPSVVTAKEDLFLFDAEAAAMLYRHLLAPAEDFLADVSNLLFDLDGALQTVPPAVLLTEDRGPALPDLEAFKAAPWLIRRYQTTILPSVRTLYAIRKYAEPPAAERPFLGIGDPVLKDHPGDSLRGRSQGGSALAWLARPKAAPLTASMLRGGRTDVGALRDLPSLPDTARELTWLAGSLGADGSRLMLRDEAREARVRDLPDIGAYRIIAFATHGLLGGEISGVSHPALVLTPPGVASAADDGVLTSAEVALLRLDADWVILSACNTAAPEGGPGTDGLSGLARAFFLAGARSLFVSHWPVSSDATVRLTTRMFELLTADPKLNRAEAHRQSMLALLGNTDEPVFSHPLFWAPFVVVGEGGRPR